MNIKTISVSQLTKTISNMFKEGIGYVNVQGEISNFKEHTSGHRYFTLKDSDAQISCALWRGKPLNFLPADGMLVVASGNLTVYPPRGSYQIDCDFLRPYGQGALFLAFEALKQKLDSLGYFDSNRKRQITKQPMKIGIATSQTGAAIQDMFSTIARRFPAVTVYFRQTLVQGGGAAEDIAGAIMDLNDTDSELIIIGRGGGSMEDLWAFNEEIVAKAIYNSRIPVISAVGHESDFTIADFVADIRAATPTAAAELVTPMTIDYFKEIINNSEKYIKSSIFELIDENKNYVSKLSNSRAFTRLPEKINVFKRQLDESQNRMEQSINAILKLNIQKITALEKHCRSIEPFAPLKRGFAVILNENKILSVYNKLSEADSIIIARQFEISRANITSSQSIDSFNEFYKKSKLINEKD